MPAAAQMGAQTYVGVPVVGSDGSIFGTLCGLDPASREVPESAVGFLSILGRLCAFHLERDEVLAAQAQARAQLETLTSELQKRHEFEQQLIGIVSHDLKNPLTGIITSAAMLVQQRGIDETARRSAKRLLSSAQRAARMVHDLLDFTEARHDRIRIRARAADLHHVLRDAVEEVHSTNAGKTIRFDSTDPVPGRWDPDRLVQVFVNLLENAIAYGDPSAPVTVSVTADGQGDSVQINIHNTGEPLSVVGTGRHDVFRATAAVRD